MTTHTRARTLTALASTLLLGATALVAGPMATATPASDTSSDAVDYFADAFPGLGTGSVFETVTYERFQWLIDNAEGSYAFLIGGPEDENVSATIGAINDVATTYGVEKIYNFDPKLDGATVDIRTSTNPVVSALYDNLVATLNKDTTPAFDQEGASDPYLFVYDSSHTSEGSEDRIVSSLDVTATATELAAPGALDAYKTLVADVFAPVSTTGPDDSTPTANLATSSQFDFYSAEVNRKHAAQFNPAELYGGDILTAEDADFRIQGVTYPELVNVLNSEGTHLILFGGTWCHNTRAMIKYINEEAQQTGFDTIYFFDLRLDGNSGNDLHIRDTNSQYSYLYGQLANTYLPNLSTQYAIDGRNNVKYYPGGDTTLELETAAKVQVPALFSYDKDHTTLDGASAPVIRQWIRDNGDGTFTEYMSEWFYTLHLPGFQTDPGKIATAYAFADEGVAKLGDFFRGVVSDCDPVADDSPAAASTTALSLAETSIAFGTATNATVTVTGPSIAGGTVALKDGAATVSTASVSATGAVLITLPGDLAVGTHSLTATFAPAATAVAAVTGSSSAAAVLTVTKAKTTTTVKVAKKAKGKKKAALKIKVKAAGVKKALVTGKVTVKIGKKKVAGKVTKGTVKVSLPKKAVKKAVNAKGKAKVKVTYKASTNLKKSKTNKKLVLVKAAKKAKKH